MAGTIVADTIQAAATSTLLIQTGNGAPTTAVSIDPTQNVTFAGNVAVTGSSTFTGNVIGAIKAATAVTASGTSVDFTSIPSTVERITVMFRGVSTNGSSFPLVQLGTSGGVVATGYTGAVLGINDANAIAGSNFTTGFSIRTVSSSTASFSGTFVFTNLTGNTWVLSGNISDTADTRISISNGFIALSGTLDRVRITTINGTDAFDAGTINILYE